MGRLDMTPEELIKHVPHPKRCMADKFDAKEGVQCEEPRGVSYWAYLPWDGILEDRHIKVHLCLLHGVYRQNGGNQMGPVILRAGAELLQQAKRAKRPSKRGHSASSSATS